MRYFEVESEAHAAKLSEGLYSVMSPDGSETKYLFGWVTANGQTYIQVPESQQPTYQKTGKIAAAKEVLSEDNTWDAKVTNPVDVTSLLGKLIEGDAKTIEAELSKMALVNEKHP